MRARSSTDEATEKADPRWFAGLAGDLAGTADDRPPLVFLHGSFRVELLPPEARMQVESTSRPEPDLVRSYWQELLTTPPEQLQASVTAAMRQIADADVPYLLILGAEPPPATRAIIEAGLPRAAVQVWPNSGHFPHLADPRRFAEQLAASAQRPLPLT